MNRGDYECHDGGTCGAEDRAECDSKCRRLITSHASPVAFLVRANDAEGVVEWMLHTGRPLNIGDRLYSAPQPAISTDTIQAALVDLFGPPLASDEVLLSRMAEAINRAHGITLRAGRSAR